MPFTRAQRFPCSGLDHASGCAAPRRGARMHQSATCTHSVTPGTRTRTGWGGKPSATQPQPPWPQTPGKSHLHWSHSDLCRWNLLLTVLTKPMFGIFFFLRAQRHGSFVTRGSCRGARPLRPRSGGSGCSQLGCIARWATLASSGVGLGAGLGGCSGAGSGSGSGAAGGRGGSLGGRAHTAWARPDFPTVPHPHFFVKKKVKG